MGCIIIHVQVDIYLIPKMAKDGKGWPKMAKDGQRWPKMAKDGQRWPKMVFISLDEALFKVQI